jgi:hypothetical protein
MTPRQSATVPTGRSTMRRRLLNALPLLMTALPAAAEVYRCEHDGLIEFSDRPCNGDSRPHEGGDRLSIIEPDPHLDQAAQRARELIRARRERLAERTRAPAPAADAPEADRGIEAGTAVFFPYGFWHRDPFADHHRPQLPDRSRPVLPEPRYSPLSGPILGTDRSEGTLYDRRARQRNQENRGP